MDALEFADTVRRLSDAARAHKLKVPSFRSPPKSPHATRAVTWYPNGEAVVSVQIHGRPRGEVVQDMVMGILLVNGAPAGSPWATVLLGAAVA